MAEPVLKLAPRPDAAPALQRQSFFLRYRRRARIILLAVIPALALIAGLAFYLSGGRYISTDNAYVGAEKVLITPDISGKISRTLVHEGQHVSVGEPLFEIDAVPFELALHQAQSKVESIRTDLSNLKSNYASLQRLVALGEQTVELRQRDVERKTSLLASRSGTQVDLDNAKAALLTAELQLQLGRQQLATTLNQLRGSPDLPIDSFPPYEQAKALLDQAQRDLDHTTVRAPIAGTATQVNSIQLGRFVSAGTPVFSIIDDASPWVDANPKETDIGYLRVGQKVEVDVDTFPDHPFHGTVTAVSPGTGAQFAILPPQNANGNWVKVVQRVPVRITFDSEQDVSELRAGMSVTVYIDTGRRRTLATLMGVSSSAAGEIRP